MKKTKLTLVLILLMAGIVNAFAQARTFPFEVSKSGQGSRSIIFIPGFASSGEVWDETKTLFESDYTCYVLTMAGFAGVAPQPNSTFKKWEESIAQYIIENEIRKPILIGHSMGGGLALAIASDYPELIEKIVVVDALPCLPALMNPTFTAAKKAECTEMINQINSATVEEFYEMQKAASKQLVADSTKQDLVLNWSMKSDRKTFGEIYCDFSNTDLRADIERIKCPALILLEAYFKNIQPTIEEQYKKLKNANLQYSEKGLHFIMYDDREWYYSRLNNFLRSN